MSRKSWYLSTFMLTASALSVYSQQENSDPTFSETREWILSKLSLSYVEPWMKGHQDDMSTQSLTIDTTSCKLVVERTEYYGNADSIKSYISFSVNISDLDYERTKYESFATGGNKVFKTSNNGIITLYTLNNEQVVVKAVKKYFSDVDYVEKDYHVSLVIPTVQNNSFENLPKRCKRALTHLLKLCGGQTEKF